MAVIEKHSPGSFCWLELGTSDQAAAKQFYGALFGWQANDFPMGPAGIYTIFQLEGRDCAAAYTLQEKGVPPNWMVYIATDNADKSTELAKSLGATVHAGPFDAMDKGRMSVVQDPVGAYFSLWQPNQSIGIGIAGVPGAYCWMDLNTPDREKAMAFYSGLFGWKFEAGKNDPAGEYLHIKNGESFIGGAQGSGMRNPNAPPHWLLYIQVANCKSTTEKAKSLGATVLAPPMVIEGTGEFSVLADPQGAVFATYQSQHQ